MLLWRAWYTGGRQFRSVMLSPDEILVTFDWRELPAEGCLAVVQWFQNGTRMIHAGEWHWIEAETVRSVPGGRPGVTTPPPPGVPAELLKRGATVPDGEWARVRSEVEAAACR